MNDSKSVRVHRKIIQKICFLKDVHHIDGGHRADTGQHQQYPLQKAEGVGGLLSTAGKREKNIKNITSQKLSIRCLRTLPQR